MSAELSGFVSTISGQVATLEAQMTQAFQELLLRIDISTHSAIQKVMNTQLDAFTSNQDSHETRVDNLEGLYSNLAFTINSNRTDFTGHTGAATGDGVHGHS